MTVGPLKRSVFGDADVSYRFFKAVKNGWKTMKEEK